jgi:hypothetical protein
MDEKRIYIFHKTIDGIRMKNVWYGEYGGIYDILQEIGKRGDI